MQALQEILDEAVHACRHYASEGSVATYIPALGQAPAQAFGACIVDISGNIACSGDFSSKFTMQSISKVASYMCCLIDSPQKEVFRKISVEPSSRPFNAIPDFETLIEAKPLNPMINAGAIAALAFVDGATPNQKVRRVRNMVQMLSGNDVIDLNEEVYRSEVDTGDRNRSIAYYLKSTGIISGSVSALLDAYFRLCSLEVDCADLARMALVMALDGRGPDGTPMVPEKVVRTARTVMATCGMYDYSGRYAISVGVPSKSGVGGGIMAVVPGRMGIGIYGPALDPFGNSVCGIELMKLLSRRLELNIF